MAGILAGDELAGSVGSLASRCSGGVWARQARGTGVQGSRVPLYRGVGPGGAPGAHAQAAAVACRGSLGLWPMGHARANGWGGADWVEPPVG
jgi:hypothetical protein